MHMHSADEKISPAAHARAGIARSKRYWHRQMREGKRLPPGARSGRGKPATYVRGERV